VPWAALPLDQRLASTADPNRRRGALVCKRQLLIEGERTRLLMVQTDFGDSA